jgi:hypothetical protein
MSIASTFLIINSKNRTTDSKSSSDFQYYIGQPIEVQSIVLKSASIPNTAYNITAKNNVMEVNINGIVRTITLTPGQYNVNQIIIILEQNFLEYGSVLTITQNSYTSRLNFTSDVNIQFIPNTNSLSTALGWVYDSTIPPGLSVTFTYPPKLAGPLNFYILSKTLGIGSNGRFAQGLQDAYLTSVPNTASWSSINLYEPHIIETSMNSYRSSINSQFIDIAIVDANLDPIDLNGADIELIFKLYLNVQTRA